MPFLFILKISLMLMVMVLMMMVTIILEQVQWTFQKRYVIMGSTSLGSYPATQSVIFTANTQLIN
jgi:hypothetical protein